MKIPVNQPSEPHTQMTNKQNITRRGPVVWAEYELKLDQLDILFRFISHAFVNLPATKRKAFVQELKSQAESETAKQMERFSKLRKLGGVLEEVIDENFLQNFQDREKKKTRVSYRDKSHAQYVEWVNDGMISAEILFRVTILEDYLKHVHAAFLLADSAILAKPKPNKNATYDAIFSKPFDQFKEQLICDEVAELDRQKMAERLKYFKTYLGVDFGKNSNFLIEISNLRNKLAHESPLYVITTDDTTLALPGIQGSIGKIVRDTMQLAFVRGKIKHPRNFLDK